VRHFIVFERPLTAAVEDYRPGYPQFAALIASHISFNVYRRFLRIRARLLLLKQDELSMLEKQLDQIDNEETRDLFLGNQRRDRNQDRRHVLEKVDVALSDYGKAPPERCHITSCLSYLFLKSVFLLFKQTPSWTETARFSPITIPGRKTSLTSRTGRKIHRASLKTRQPTFPILMISLR